MARVGQSALGRGHHRGVLAGAGEAAQPYRRRACLWRPPVPRRRWA